MNKHLSTFKTPFGSRSFSRIGPKLWNLLPMEIRMKTETEKFKTALKTYLFDEYDHLAQKLLEI